MPSSTTRAGLPYPIGTDPVSDGDDAIKNLANRLDGSSGALASAPYGMAAGTVSVVFSNVPNSSAAVTFPAGRFSQPPNVLTAGQNSFFVTAAGSITATGFTMNVRHAQNTNQTTTVPTNWVAVQMTSASANG